MSDAYLGEIGAVRPSAAAPARDDFDLGSIGRAIRANARPIIGLTLLALIASFLYVSLVTPRYTGEAAILLETGENFYTRPGSERDPAAQPAPIDDQAVQSQVLLLSSRAMSIDAIRRLNLVGNPEFDPLAGPPQPWMRLLILAGLVENPANLSPEDRVLDKFSDRLRVFPARGSRVINIEFTSSDPKLAADGANTMAALYLKAQETAKLNSARSAGTWLSDTIQPLRKKVDEAEAKVEAFRAKYGLLMGTNNTTIDTQQLADLNTQLANARAIQADARSKAKLLREMIQSGRMLEISEVANNELIRRLSEQRATLSSQIALEGRTLLPQHPRMKELTAQLADLDKQIRLAAEKTVRGLENDARIAGSRVETVSATLDEQKKASSLANEKEVELRSLERDAKTARDQLEAYMAKYREASARDDDKAVPPDARIIAHALAPSTPSFPKKIPIISIATLATLLLSVATVVAKEVAFPTPDRGPGNPGPVRGKDARRRKAEPAVEGRTPIPEALVTEGAVAALSAAIEPVAGAPGEPPGAAELDGARDAPEHSAEEPPVVVAADPGEPHPAMPPQTTEISAVAAHLVSLKPLARGIIVLLSRASDQDHAPSFALPLGRDIAKDHRTVLVDLVQRGTEGLSQAIGLAEAPGLTDLMASEIGFADAIHRDPQSNLHIVPAGLSAAKTGDLTEGRDLSVVLKALARTYDAVLLDTRSIDEAATMKRLIAAVDVTLIVRGEADEAAMAATLERFAAEKPAVLLAVEAAANDDREPTAAAVA
jgi:uncharacterized protein involved in exopolysaccharide biosynthesis/Mrp family chromosome partitioning ATPase